MAPVQSQLCAVILVAALAAQCHGFAFNKGAKTLQAAMGGAPPSRAFKAWQSKYKKVYPTEQEAQRRYNVWLTNAQRVVELNSKDDRKMKLGLNGLADLTREEFRSKMIAPQPMELTYGRERAPLSKSSGPVSWRYEHIKPKRSVDWRDQGIMGPVRSQHANNWSCGGCWSFATAGIAEASSALFTGIVIPASEQQLIDCDRKHDHGCGGGDFHNGLDYIIYNHGLTTEDNYPYAGQNNPCDVAKEKDHQVRIDDWESVPPFNETALVQALTMRPVVTAICCGNNIDDWHHYDGGVFDTPCCQDKLTLDHAVVLVGYGKTPQGEEYYIMKNSWSDAWGEKGYMRLKRGVGPKPFVSQCGLASMPTMVFRGPKPPAPSEEEEAEEEA